VKRFFFALWFCALPAFGQAQVIVHQAALDQLAGLAPVAAVPVVVPVVQPRHRKIFRAVSHAVVAVKPASAPAVIVPVVVKPAPAAPFVPAPPVSPPATVAVARPAPALPAAPGAVVLRFAGGDDSLPGDAAAALRPVCAAAKSGSFVAVDAYAPADKTDPSAAMRLSLSRAFAVRDALAACGVPPSHIIPRADGAAGDPATARISLGQGK
jgi:hypothetical protein